MIAWVLVVYMNTQYSYTISNIESEHECKRLHEQIKSASLFGPPGQCFSYRVAYRF